MVTPQELRKEVNSQLHERLREYGNDDRWYDLSFRSDPFETGLHRQISMTSSSGRAPFTLGIKFGNVDTEGILEKICSVHDIISGDPAMGFWFGLTGLATKKPFLYHVDSLHLVPHGEGFRMYSQPRDVIEDKYPALASIPGNASLGETAKTYVDMALPPLAQIEDRLMELGHMREVAAIQS